MRRWRVVCGFAALSVVCAAARGRANPQQLTTRTAAFKAQASPSGARRRAWPMQPRARRGVWALIECAAAEAAATRSTRSWIRCRDRNGCRGRLRGHKSSDPQTPRRARGCIVRRASARMYRVASSSSEAFIPKRSVTLPVWSGPEDRGAVRRRGKSELSRAAGWLTARRGNATESATENRPPIASGPQGTRRR
jgi:hypothetical protein